MSNAPLKVIHKRSMRAEIYFILLMLGFIALAYLALREIQPAILAGLIAYYALALIMYLLFQREHRRAIRLMRAGQYAQAIPLFERSLARLRRRPRIDRWRWLTMHTSSAWPYLDMDRHNLSLCYLHESRVEEALSLLRELASGGTAPELCEQAIQLEQQILEFQAQQDQQME